MFKHTHTLAAWLLPFALGIPALDAAEHRGAVKAAGLAMPGAVVIAIQAEKKVTTTTDENGVFSFADLADGEWTIEVQTLGFETLRRRVTVGPSSPASAWNLKFLPKDSLMAALTKSDAHPAVRSTGTAAQFPARGRQPSGGNGHEGALRNEEATELSQSAANSFLVQGSISSAAGLPQRSDWGFGPRGLSIDGMGIDGMERPLGMGPGGDGQLSPNPGMPPQAGLHGGAGDPPGGPGGFRGPGGFGGPRGAGEGRGPVG